MKILILCLLVLAFQTQCGKFDWVKPQKQNQGLPSSVQIFKLNTTNSVFGTNLTGAFARFDFTDRNLEFKVAHTEDEKSKTPMQWAQADQNLVYGVINGGFFDMQKNESASFICSNSHVYHPNGINAQPSSKIFPTVGAIGVLQNETFDIEWIYSFDKEFQTYAYPSPNPYPGAAPIRSNGKYWNVKEGIGAGSILVKNNTLIKGNPEHFNVNNMVYTRHPRSGVCYDKAGRLLLVAIDGRYSGSAGLTFEQFGIVLQDMGCVDALNLDGGGSTLLYANNYILNHYSDAVPRPVVSAIVIRDKHKKKQSNLVSQ